MSSAIPLLGSVAPVSAEVLARQDRTALVSGIGESGLSRLRTARVLVVGAGGLGSPVLQYLAAAGVGRVGISDADVVEESNLQRQVIHDRAAVGTAKTRSAAARVRALGQDVDVVELPRMDADELARQEGCWDLLLDCTDTFPAKYLLADWAAQTGIPEVFGTVVGMTFQVTVLWSRAGSGLDRTLRDLHPTIPPEGSTPTSRTAGILGSVAGQAGTAMATEAIKLITGAGEPLLGRVLVVDAARGRHDVIPFAGRSDHVDHA